MISGNSHWSTALNAQTKHPLWVFSIPNKSVYLGNFINVLTAFTDLATSGAGVAVVTSASFTFEPWMVGYWIPIAAGTNFVADNYKITAYNGPNSVTVNTSPTPSGAGSSGIGTLQLAVNLPAGIIPTMQVPKGSSQQVDELNGHSAISGFDFSCIDNSGLLKTTASDASAIGQACTLRLGFPGGDFSDIDSFVIVDSGMVSTFDWTDAGMVSISVQSTMLDLVSQIFTNGGPALWFQMTASAVISLTSSHTADKRVITIVGYDTTGTKILTELVVLNGTTEVLSINTYSSIISLSTLIGSYLWTVTIRQGASGSAMGTIPKGATVLGGRIQAPSVPPAYLDNGYPVSDSNPRYVSGNPIDLLMAVTQNELGVGQANPPVLVVTTGGGSGTGQVGFGINPTWVLYDGGVGLINPNRYVDIPALEALRDTDFAGDILEFKLTSPQNGKSWCEQEILKICGLYWIVKANGQLTPKSMKFPVSIGSPPTISDRQIVGIPTSSRWSIINTIHFEVPTGDDGDTTALVAFANQTSLNLYKAPYILSVQSAGLRFGRGAYTRMALLSNRIFNRHAFKTPVYDFTTFFKNIVFELGDLFYLTHPQVIDFKSGTRGITNVLCEVIGRAPDYATGNMKITAIDTRFISKSNGGFEIAAAADSIPAWGSASSGQKAQYMFISDNNGQMSDLTAANEIS
jgi:hypothetical protein